MQFLVLKSQNCHKVYPFSKKEELKSFKASHTQLSSVSRTLLEVSARNPLEFVLPWPCFVTPFPLLCLLFLENFSIHR